MADTYSPTLNLVKPEINGSLNTWGNKVNANADLIDAYAATAAAQIATLTAGVATATAGGVPLGTILMWSGAVAAIPTGYKLCDGTFGTPDLRSRFVMGAGNGGAYPAPGAMGGATTATASTDTVGAHNHTAVTGSTALTAAQMPTHSHTGATNPVGEHDHEAPTPGQATGSGGAFTVFHNGMGFNGNRTGPGGSHAHAFTTDAAGSGASHNHSISSDGSHAHSVTVATLPPYIVLAFIQRVS